ncbi:MAG: hypothetical protein IH586_08695, partial [Anaerolineaceae bacterium]|nr:hypothetical protein [Anaerolineaceae bacterium]
MHKLIRAIITAVTLFSIGIVPNGDHPANAAVTLAGGNIYLPQIFNNAVNLSNIRTVNVPYFQVTSVTESKFEEMGIFWFGKVRPDINYTDVRIGYNDEALWVYTASIDRRLWYNTSSNGNNLESWDAATLLLHVDGSTQPMYPLTQSYRFVSQFHSWEGSSNYQKAYRGDGVQWVAQNLPFITLPGWRGNAINDNLDDKGWVMTFKIPFTSLGMNGKPPAGTIWRLGIMTHDRDTEAGPALTDQVWPELLNRQSPASWGILRFGLPDYSRPNVSNMQTTMIRHRLNGAVVPDTDAGGYANCGGSLDYWTEWG